jgi:transcriptional regulator with XRE-family HTH domain
MSERTAPHKALGARLKAARKRFPGGLSQEGVARKLDVGVSAVSLWERGVNVPNPTHLVALADLLGLHAGPLASEAAQSIFDRALCQDEASKGGQVLRVRRRRHEQTVTDRAAVVRGAK